MKTTGECACKTKCYFSVTFMLHSRASDGLRRLIMLHPNADRLE
nr:MAG TPA: hypothetical protein [Caudoviricetes sp.]